MKPTTANTGMEASGFSVADYLKITIFGFGLTALWMSLHSVALPVRLLDFVAESDKNTYLGLLTFAGLVLAVIVQPMVGALSDRATFLMGRRRPFIVIGVAGVVLLMPGILLVKSYALLFIIYCLMQVFSNTAQGPYQAFIPDLVPENKRGTAAGVKTLMEVLGGMAFLYPVGLLMDSYSGGSAQSWFWLALGMLATVLIGATVATVLIVRERREGMPLASLPNWYQCFRIDVRHHHNFVWFLVSRFFMLMAFTTLQTFALYFLRDMVSVPNPATATATLSIVSVSGMLVGALPAGRLSDRFGRRRISVSAGMLSAMGAGLIFLFQHNYPLILFAGAIIGVSFGAFMSPNWALATDLVIRGEEARCLGLTNLATAGGAALARLIGPVIDFFNGVSFGLGYSIMLLSTTAYFVAGSLLMLKIRGSSKRGQN